MELAKVPFLISSWFNKSKFWYYKINNSEVNKYPVYLRTKNFKQAIVLVWRFFSDLTCLII